MVSANTSAHPYRTQTCGGLNLNDVGLSVRLAGWVHRKRDHGNLLFLDLRDHYGITQCVVDQDNPAFVAVDALKLESVISLDGTVIKRSPETCNPKMATGDIELGITSLSLLSAADPLPLQVNTHTDGPEDTRLKYRFLDLRRDRLHQNIVLRAQVIASLRRRMMDQGFLELQTPILTASSPEGARDFLVPSRLHPGSFYALPQAPQQFKQMLMVAGFDRYFQIAPCFRDEDSRADRSPGEFYQLDFEMAFATQEDVFAALEPVLHGVFEEFAKGRTLPPLPFPQISYTDAMLTYGSDKPDLRNPLRIQDLSTFFADTGFTVFADTVRQGGVVRAIRVSDVASNPRSFFDKLGKWAQEMGAAGLAYLVYETDQVRGPVAKFLTPLQQETLAQQMGARAGDVVFFIAGPKAFAEKLSGALRKKLGQDLELLEKDTFRFCWIVDFPMYEKDEKTGQITFSHNPFSMPQGGLKALETQDPLTIKAYQYDIVCNGVELSSGAIRNHLPEVMFKAFALAGYTQEEVEKQFGGLLRAFQYGAPPHGGSAPGVDRIVMLLANEPNLREVVAFPLNQQAQDLLMQAPAPVSPAHLKELGLKRLQET